MTIFWFNKIFSDLRCVDSFSVNYTPNLGGFFHFFNNPKMSIWGEENFKKFWDLLKTWDEKFFLVKLILSESLVSSPTSLDVDSSSWKISHLLCFRYPMINSSVWGGLLGFFNFRLSELLTNVILGKKGGKKGFFECGARSRSHCLSLGKIGGKKRGEKALTTTPV